VSRGGVRASPRNRRHEDAVDRVWTEGCWISEVVVGEGRSRVTAGPVTVEDGAGHAQNGKRGHPGMPKTRHVEGDRPTGAV